MNIFLDCGFYAGNALKKYLDNGTVDDTWTIYAFEPNPELNTKERIKSYPVKINLIKKAVWTKNGTVTFHLGGREDSSSVMGTTGHTEPKKVRVRTIDFSEFVAQLPAIAYIICSMDIEGSEYSVLEKMIADNTVNRFGILDIEFHHRFMANETQEDSQELIDELERRNIEVVLKVPLN